MDSSDISNISTGGDSGSEGLNLDDHDGMDTTRGSAEACCGNCAENAAAHHAEMARMQADMAQMRAAAAAHQEEMARMRAAHQEEMARMRAAHQEAMAGVAHAIGLIGRRLDVLYPVCTYCWRVVLAL